MSQKRISKQGFPRHVRLLSAEDYKKVFAQSVRSTDRFFTVLARHEGQQHPARLGLAVAKKHVRRAVDRNRIKRLLRESFRHHQQQLQGLDLVVLVKPGIHKADNAALFRSLEKHWKRLSKEIPS
ncbi:ribonuclease P protein component [Thiolapillus sp.]